MEGRRLLPVVTLAVLSCTLTALRADSKLTPSTVLRALEKVSAPLWRPTHAEVRKAYGSDLTDSRLTVAADLLGPVSRDSLEHRFEWTIASESPQFVILRAMPRDKAEALFVGPIELTLSRATGDIDDLRFCDLPVTVADRKEQHSPIRLVSNVRVDQVAAESGISPELNQVLEKWQKSTASIQNLKLSFERYRYDRAFNLETRAVGRFVFVAPNTGMYRIQPAPIPVGTESKIIGTDGQRFTLRTDAPESLVWDGMSVTVADDKYRTLQTLEVPRQDAGIQRVVGSWDNVWAGITQPQVALPCVVDVNVKDLKERFQLSVLRADEQHVVLQCLPAEPSARRQLSEMMVIIDPQTHLTKATKFVGPSGDLEIVHVFLYEQINQPEVAQKTWAPELGDYRRMEMPPPAPPAE